MATTFNSEMKIALAICIAAIGISVVFNIWPYTQIGSLRTENNLLQSQVNSLETESNLLQSQVNSLETENSQQQGQNDVLQGENARLLNLISLTHSIRRLPKPRAPRSCLCIE